MEITLPRPLTRLAALRFNEGVCFALEGTVLGNRMDTTCKQGRHQISTILWMQCSEFLGCRQHPVLG